MSITSRLSPLQSRPKRGAIEFKTGGCRQALPMATTYLRDAAYQRYGPDNIYLRLHIMLAENVLAQLESLKRKTLVSPSGSISTVPNGGGIGTKQIYWAQPKWIRDLAPA